MPARALEGVEAYVQRCQPAAKAMELRFSYLAAPNLDLQTVEETIDVSATPDKVWALIG